MHIEYKCYMEQARKIWDDFSNDIKYNNRYFIGDKVSKILKNIVSYSSTSSLFDEDTVFRARIGNFIDKDEKEIKSPPMGKALDGRGNPRGISYFYTSTKTHTAIAEVRPFNGALVTVGEFVTKEDIHLIDFRSISIRENNSSRKLPISPLERCFSEVLLEKLSAPILPEDSLEYIPLQYITEYIKLKGYGGLIYKSVVCDEANMLFFNDSKFDLIDRKLYKITEMKYGYKEIDVY